MADVFTIIVTILIVIAFLITNLYIIAYYCHPDDKGSTIGWVLKIIVIIGLTLSWIQVLLLPLDVSDHRTFGGGMNMRNFWYAIYIITLIYILIISPLAKSYYETDETWSIKEKISHSLCLVSILLVIFIILSIIFYASCKEAKITTYAIKCNFSENVSSSFNEFSENPQCDMSEEKIIIKANYIVICIALLLIYSWVVFAFFGGIGLASVPIDLFYSFCTRPKHINSNEILNRKVNLIKDVEEIKKLGEDVKRMELQGFNKKFFFSKDRREYDRKINQFRSGYILVNKEYKIVNVENEARKKGNCVFVWYYALLPLGILSSIVSLLWIIQFICSFFARSHGRPAIMFLSTMFIFFQDHDCAFLSFIIFALMNLYLLFCTIKGNFKFGFRLFCCSEFYPMKKNGTYMNSFLFNVNLILVASCAITHFSSECFYDYVAFTDLDIIFNQIINNLKFFEFFYDNHIFQIIFFIIFVISLIYFLWKPRDSIRAVVHKSSPLDTSSSNNSNNQINENDHNESTSKIGE